MTQKKHKFAFLVLLVLMGQTSLLVHDFKHAVDEDLSDCLFCIKLDKQENALILSSLPAFVAQYNNGQLPGYSAIAEKSVWTTCLTRAPPTTV